MPTQNKNTVIFDKKDWLGGVDYFKTSTDFETEGRGLALVASFDPIRFLGHASPGYQYTGATNQSNITAYLVNGVQKNGNAYTLSSDGKLHEVTGITGAGTVANLHTIAGMTPIGSDCVKYYVNTGSLATPNNIEYLFYSYSTTTFWDIGRFDFSAAFDDTYMSATASPALGASYRAGGTGYPHPLIVGDNNKMYIGDRNFVHQFDGQVPVVGAFTPNVLDLPTGFIITSFVNWKNYLVIFAYKENASTSFFYLGEAKAFFWDTFSDSFTYAVDLKDNYVSEAVNFRNTIACFTSGSPDSLYASTGAMGGTRLKIFNGESFINEKTFNAAALPARGGVQVINDDIYFNAGGFLFSYINLEGKYIMNELNSVSGSSGMLKSFTGTFNFHISRGTGASGEGLISYLDPNTYFASCTLATKAIEPMFPDYSQGRMKKIKITYLKPASGGRSLALQIYRDSTTTDTIFTGKQIVTSLVEEYFVDSSNNPLGSFKQLQLYLIWSSGGGSSNAPVVTRVEVEYEIIKIQ